MTIARKINMMVITIVGIFSILLAVLVLMNIRTNRYLALQQRFAAFEADISGLNSRAKDLLIGEQEIWYLVDLLDEARAAVRSSLTLIEESPEADLIVGQMEEDFVSVKTLYDQTSGTFDQIAANLRALNTNQNLQRLIRRYGVFHMRVALAIEDPTNAAAFYLNTAITDVTRGQFFFEDAMIPLVSKVRDGLTAEITALRELTLIVILGASGIIIGLNLLIGLSFTNRFRKRIKGLESIMISASCRDIRGRAMESGTDEITNLSKGLNHVLNTLHQFLWEARKTSTAMSGVNEALAASSTESTAALNQISSNVDSISTQISSLDKMIESAAAEIEHVRQEIEGLALDIDRQSHLVSLSVEQAQAMGGRIEEVHEDTRTRKAATDSLYQTTVQGGEKLESTHGLIDAVSRDIDSIGEIIDLINHIADQTSILSLNASIESAHAGEAGKGFAIVAQEIQKLAESTSENSARIGESLRGMAEKIQEARQYSEYSQDAFSDIQDEISSFVTSFNTITARMDQLKEASFTITGVSKELGEISEGIRSRALGMNTGVAAISKAASQASDHSHVILQGMQEIDVGARDVLESMIHVQRMASDGKDQVESLVRFMSSYKMDETVDMTGDDQRQNSGCSDEV